MGIGAIFKPGQMLSNNKSLINKAIDTGITQKVITQIADSKAILPVLLLEGTVVAGRCSQAKKRDELEFKERFREELLTSAVWLFGVDAFNKSFDFILKKALKLDTSADVFNSDVFQRFTKGRSDSFKNTLIGAKFTKVAISTAATIYIIGSLIPKLNQHLTKKDIAKKKEEQSQIKVQKTENSAAVSLTNGLPDTPLNRKLATFGKPIAESVLKLKSLPLNQSKSMPSFKGNFIKLINSAGYNMESNPWFKLWTGDAGVSGGRAIHARNNDERAEILFRDVGSIFFYMFSTSLTIKALSKLFDDKLGIHSKINPSLTTHLNKEILGQNIKNASYEDFAKAVRGQEGHKPIVDNLLNGLTPEKIEQIEKSSFEKSWANLGNRINKLLRKTPKPETQNPIYSLENLLSKNINDKTLHEAITTKAKLNAQIPVSDSIRAISNKLQDMGYSLSDGLCKEANEIADKMYKNAQLGHIDEIITDEKKLKEMLKSFKNNLPKDSVKGFEPLFKAVSDSLTSSAKLSKTEIEEIIKGGLIHKTKFIGESATIAFGPTWFQKIPNYLNPKRHIDAADVEGVKENIGKYTEKLLDYVKKHTNGSEELGQEKISKLITGFKNKTALIKIAYSVSGFGVSALFLSYLIPKWQQILTKMRTGSDKFPGTKDM
jgi:hypothetical protein